jgi:hypothetical protein
VTVAVVAVVAAVVVAVAVEAVEAVAVGGRRRTKRRADRSRMRGRTSLWMPRSAYRWTHVRCGRRRQRRRPRDPKYACESIADAVPLAPETARLSCHLRCAAPDGAADERSDAILRRHGCGHRQQARKEGPRWKRPVWGVDMNRAAKGGDECARRGHECV